MLLDSVENCQTQNLKFKKKIVAHIHLLKSLWPMHWFVQDNRGNKHNLENALQMKYTATEKDKSILERDIQKISWNWIDLRYDDLLQFSSSIGIIESHQIISNQITQRELNSTKNYKPKLKLIGHKQNSVEY